MAQGNSIKFILFLYCLSQSLFSFASLRREHVPKPRDQEAQFYSPSSPSSSVIYGDDLEASTSPIPRASVSIATDKKFLPDRELFLSPEAQRTCSDHSTTYHPETSPSFSYQSGPTLSQPTLLEKQKELAHLTKRLMNEYCDQVMIESLQFKNMLRDYKNHHSNASQDPNAESNNPTITPFQDFIKKHLPDHTTEIVMPAAQNPEYPRSVTTVQGNKIFLYPEFFKLTPNKQEAELQFAIANIQSDDYYWLNTMNNYYDKISEKLEEEKQNEIENLLEVYQFVRIQSAFIQAMLTTKNTETLDVLQRQHQQVIFDNPELENQKQNLKHDSIVNSCITTMVAETKQYLTARDQQNKERDQQATTLPKQSGKKRLRK